MVYNKPFKSGQRTWKGSEQFIGRKRFICLHYSTIGSSFACKIDSIQKLIFWSKVVLQSLAPEFGVQTSKRFAEPFGQLFFADHSQTILPFQLLDAPSINQCSNIRMPYQIEFSKFNSVIYSLHERGTRLLINETRVNATAIERSRPTNCCCQIGSTNPPVA